MIYTGHPFTFDDIMVISMTKLPDARMIVLEMSNLTRKVYKDPQWQSESINQSTSNAMAKRRKEKCTRNVIYKTLHRKVKIEQHELHLKSE